MQIQKQPGYLPDHRWVPDEQRIVVHPEDVGEPAGVPVDVQGLALADNGDLLMAVNVAGGGGGPHGRDPDGPPRMVLLRSADRGRSWSPQNRLEYRRTEVGRESFVGLHRTNSGRLVGFLAALDQQYHVERYPRADDLFYIDGGHNFRVDVLRSAQCAVYSEDEGRTWTRVPIDISPFRSITISDMRGSIFRTADGTLVQPFIGNLTRAELDAAIQSVGIIRSRDDGLTWGDVSVVVRGRPGSALWYNETAIVELPDGTWFCLMRINDSNIANAPLFGARCTSSDKGYTWTEPVRNRFGLHEHTLIRLSDGAILSTGGVGGGAIEAHVTAEGNLKLTDIPASESGNRRTRLYHLSYDGGFTWSYWGVFYTTEPGSPEHTGSTIAKQLDDETLIVVYHCGLGTAAAKKQGGYGPMVVGASWLRRVPADDPETAGLGYPEWLQEMRLARAVAEAEKIVTLPEEWRFRFDAGDKGLAAMWYKETDISGWDRIRIDRPWTSQGERQYGLGVGWYATEFEMPEAPVRPLALVFGAVDGVCDVFVDGEKIGEQKVSPRIMWDRPFALPLDQGLAPGRHVVVVRVRKESAAAGVHKPVWIAAGSDVLLAAGG